MKKFLQTFTNVMYCLILIAGLVWISTSYVISIYGVIRFGQVEPLIELSCEVIRCIIVVVVAKTIANIFEHNDGPVFGYSNNCAPMSEEGDVPRG